MIGIVERLRFDAARCELQFSKGVAGNIEEAAAEIERLRTALEDVSNPMRFLQRHAEAEGARLNGLAYSIANDLHFVQKIARDALAQ